MFFSVHHLYNEGISRVKKEGRCQAVKRKIYDIQGSFYFYEFMANHLLYGNLVPRTLKVS